ncbi:MAG: AAA family ATPase [Myxococcales bacterium]|nr:AAA family ATPase [Myxococcales bacterium]
MSRRLAIASQKGGCGKTTTALNLSLALAERGQRTLLVDLDPQGGVGHALARPDQALHGLADVLMGACGIGQAVMQTKLPGLSLLPRGRLDPIDVCEYEMALLDADVLSEHLALAEAGYDLVIVDTPSGLGIPTRAALRIADFVLLPVQAEPLALRTITQALRLVEHVRLHENPRLHLLGLLPTMVARESEASMGVLIAAWRDLTGVLETTIPRAEVFARASEAGLPVSYLAGKPPPEGRRFDLLAGELEILISQVDKEGPTDVERQARQLL